MCTLAITGVGFAISNMTRSWVILFSDAETPITTALALSVPLLWFLKICYSFKYFKKCSPTHKCCMYTRSITNRIQ